MGTSPEKRNIVSTVHILGLHLPDLSASNYYQGSNNVPKEGWPFGVHMARAEVYGDAIQRPRILEAATSCTGTFRLFDWNTPGNLQSTFITYAVKCDKCDHTFALSTTVPTFASGPDYSPKISVLLTAWYMIAVGATQLFLAQNNRGQLPFYAICNPNVVELRGSAKEIIESSLEQLMPNSLTAKPLSSQELFRIPWWQSCGIGVAHIVGPRQDALEGSFMGALHLMTHLEQRFQEAITRAATQAKSASGAWHLR